VYRIIASCAGSFGLDYKVGRLVLIIIFWIKVANIPLWRISRFVWIKSINHQIKKVLV